MDIAALERAVTDALVALDHSRQMSSEMEPLYKIKRKALTNQWTAIDKSVERETWTNSGRNLSPRDHVETNSDLRFM